MRGRDIITLAYAVSATVLLAAATATSAAAQAGCTMDTQCKGDRVCDEGVCRTAPPPAVTVCSVDAECPGAEVCEGGACRLTTAARPVLPPAPASPVVATAPPPPPATTAPAATPSAGAAEEAYDGILRKGLADDSSFALGMLGASGGGDSLMTFGWSAAIGGYLSPRLALMLTSSYDIVLGEESLELYTLGAGLRFSGRHSNSALRVGLGLAALSFETGGDAGLGLTSNLMIAGKGRFGLNLDSVVGSFDGFTAYRFSLGFGYIR